MNDLSLEWLGQSGFVLRSPEGVVACDLYLSDYCKKRSKLDHTRLTPIPVKPENLTGIDFYLATHPHIDHFDPETVGPLLEANPKMRVLCPPSGAKVIDEFFKDRAERFEFVRSGKELSLSKGLRLLAVPAAHEQLEKDSSGEFIAFSYVLLFDALKKAVFFAGDTIPYGGQVDFARAAAPRSWPMAMALPVNGRDAARAKLGFKGNFTLEEAVAFFKACEGSLFIPCHFGMFALNDFKGHIDAKLFEGLGVKAAVPVIGKRIDF